MSDVQHRAKSQIIDIATQWLSRAFIIFTLPLLVWSINRLVDQVDKLVTQMTEIQVSQARRDADAENMSRRLDVFSGYMKTQMDDLKVIDGRLDTVEKDIINVRGKCEQAAKGCNP